MAVNYGSKRIVTGAHYGLRDWLSQRVTAGLMALFTIVLLVQVLFGGPLGYDRWAAIFSAQWMKVLTFVVIVALGWEGEGVRVVFTGTVDEVRSSGSRGSGRTLSITAKGMDTTGKPKEGQQRHFDDSTVATSWRTAALPSSDLPASSSTGTSR